MGAAILTLLSVMAALGQAADPQGLSPSVNQGKVLSQSIQSLPPSLFLGTPQEAPQAPPVRTEIASAAGRCAIPLTRVPATANAVPLINILPGNARDADRMPVAVPVPACPDPK